MRCYVKGAPDVLIARSSMILGADGKIDPLDKMTHQRALELNEQLASKGMRVMVVASSDLDPATFDPEADLLPEVDQLTLSWLPRFHCCSEFLRRSPLRHSSGASA